MARESSPAAPALARLRRGAACLVAVLLLSGCASSPLPFSGPMDVRSLEVTIQEVPPPEVYYHRRQPPGLLGYLGTAAFMGSTIYRSWADSQKTERLAPRLRGLKPAEELAGPFVETLRKARVFRRVDVRKAGEPPGGGRPYDAFIELMVDRWGMSYATEGRLSAEVVVEGRMRPARQGEELLWRRRLVETDGARTDMETLAADPRLLETLVRRTLRAAGADLARDLLKPLKTLQPRLLLPPEI